MFGVEDDQCGGNDFADPPRVDGIGEAGAQPPRRALAPSVILSVSRQPAAALSGDWNRRTM